MPVARARPVTIGTMESSTTSDRARGGARIAAAARRLALRLDPRRRLAAAIGWAVLLVLAPASLVAGNLAAADAERAAHQGIQRLMTQFADQVALGLATKLQTRLSIIQTTAAQIAASDDRSAPAIRRHLEAVRAQFPEFVWVGLADADGRIVTATGGGVAPGAGVADRPWFTAARSAPFLGEVRPAGLPGTPPRAGGHVVDAAAPVRGDGAGGVLGAQLSWPWIERLDRELLASLDTHGRLEVILIDRDGGVLAGPPGWPGRTVTPGEDLSEGGRWVVGRHDAAPAAGGGPAWTVIVRQGAGVALAGVQHLRRTVLATVLAAGILASGAALALTHWLTRRLDALAAQAQAVRRGRRSAIDAPRGDDEVSRIGATMAELVAHLQREKESLAGLNAQLDARVAERTARIARLAEEAQHAAVTRERLRLARELHDTLAHSLMALLQQIRLVRKLHRRMSAEELGAELGRAEEVAAAGLAEARAAILQMRRDTVRESGLAAALRDLLARFAERTGVQATLAAEGAASDLADERAETLYRIVEEALRNVERHAGAASVTVRIASAGAARTRIEIRDDGIGFDPDLPRPGHYGMLGMREQAALIGAAFDVASSAGAGTLIGLEFEP